MTPKRRGRPPIDPTDGSIRVTVTLPVKQYDALCKVAQQQAESLPEVIRRSLERGSNKRINK
jgi:hypothetical protein